MFVAKNCKFGAPLRHPYLETSYMIYIRGPFYDRNGKVSKGRPKQVKVIVFERPHNLRLALVRMGKKDSSQQTANLLARFQAIRMN